MVALGALLWALGSPAVAETGVVALPESCVGDCNLDGFVTVDEVIVMVTIALGEPDLARCPAGDANDDRAIEIDEVIAAVHGTLRGCASAPTPTVTPTATPTPTPTFVCGNGQWRNEPPEQCDDDNTRSGDGCDAGCRVEPGFRCEGEPSECAIVVNCGGTNPECSPTPTGDLRPRIRPTPTPPADRRRG